MALKLLSLNVRGLASARKRDCFLHELDRLDYDVYFLQETHASCKRSADLFANAWKGQCLWSFGLGKSAGVAILFSPNFSGKIIRYLHDFDGRILSVLVEIDSVKINLVCLYAPNTVSDRRVFFENVHAFFLFRGSLVLGGDFNCIDSDIDRMNIKSDFSADKGVLSALKTDFSLVDV